LRARDARDPTRQCRQRQVSVIASEGAREHNRTTIETIAFLIAFARYVILSKVRLETVANTRDSVSGEGTEVMPVKYRTICTCLLYEYVR